MTGSATAIRAREQHQAAQSVGTMAGSIHRLLACTISHVERMRERYNRALALVRTSIGWGASGPAYTSRKFRF